MKDTYIAITSNDAVDPKRPKVKGRPVIEQFRTNLEKLAQLLSIKLPELSSPNQLIQWMTDQLEAVPYIPYPVSLSTVDMVGVTYKVLNGKRVPFILMGRRSENHLWQFPGGFRDPAERSQEAAWREYIEETSLHLPIDRFKFIDDMFVDDRRYRDTPHKITTSIFLAKVKASEAKLAIAADDIFEVKWMNVNTLRENREGLVRDVHMGLFNFIKKYIK